MFQTVFLCVAALFMGNCKSESADLQVLIDGLSVGKSASCTGENVTYVCNIASTSHSWIINGGSILAVSRTPQVIDERYTLRLVSANGTIVSSLSVTSFDGLNGINLTCADPDIINPLPPQETVAMVLDPPSIPMLSIIVDDIEALNITVTPPSVSPVCVLQYNISYSSSCDSRVTNIPVIPNIIPTRPVQLTREFFNLCDCSYTFTVAANTRNGIGERSNPISVDSLSMAIIDPDLNINTSNFNVTISVTAPEVINIVMKYTNVGGTNVSLDVRKMNGMAESATLLECGFTNSRVDFFVEFIFQCGMKTITDTTSPLPQLISSVTQSASTINSIHLVLNVRECMGKDQLRVSSFVSDGNTVISQMSTSLNGVMSELILENVELIADKDYMCNVSIMEGGTTLDSMTIPCQTSSSSMSSDSSSPTTVIIIIVIVCCVVLIAIIAVLACVICLKKKKDTNDTGATSKNNPPTYQDPSTIKHETAADGEVYTMVDKKPKTKKGKKEKDDVAAMYSMPDKSKKNPELTYADIQVSNPQHPPNNRGIGNRSVIQQDTSSITYASVESPTTKF